MVLTGWRTPSVRNLWEEITPENLHLWQRERRGPMATFGADFGGFGRSFSDRMAPDLQFGAIPGPPPLAECEPLAGVTAGEMMPSANVDDDEQIREWIRTTSGTMFHPTGTAAMGSNAEAVCDAELRVRGVEGLRIVDGVRNARDTARKHQRPDDRHC